MEIGKSEHYADVLLSLFFFLICPLTLQLKIGLQGREAELLNSEELNERARTIPCEQDEGRKRTHGKNTNSSLHSA